MDQAHYERFLEASAKGLKSEAHVEIRAFVASFSSLAEKRAWVSTHMEELHRLSGSQIRHELFTGVVLPVLSEGYAQKDAESAFMLAQLWDNLVAARGAYERLGSPTLADLLVSAHELEPKVERYSSALLLEYMRQFSFCDHHWPSGILYTARESATLEELAALDQDVEKARRLDTSGANASRLNQFQQRVDTYRKRLEAAKAARRE